MRLRQRTIAKMALRAPGPRTVAAKKETSVARVS